MPTLHSQSGVKVALAGALTSTPPPSPSPTHPPFTPQAQPPLHPGFLPSQLHPSPYPHPHLSCLLSSYPLSSLAHTPPRPAPSLPAHTPQATIMADAATPDLKRAAVCEVVAVSDYSLVVGADEMLQLLHVAGQVHQAYTAAA